jgi:hypothetical protein
VSAKAKTDRPPTHPRERPALVRNESWGTDLVMPKRHSPLSCREPGACGGKVAHAQRVVTLFTCPNAIHRVLLGLRILRFLRKGWFFRWNGAWKVARVRVYRQTQTQTRRQSSDTDRQIKDTNMGLK